MKNFSLALNLILVAAVIFLFVKVFSGNKNEQHAAPAVQAGHSQSFQSAPIAFVELDSLNEKISYIKNKRAELEVQQKSIETEWQNGYRILENKKNEFMKRMNSVTQAEGEKFQQDLLQEQQLVDGRKQDESQALSQKSYTLMDGIQKRLKEFLNDYNKDKKYQYILTTGSGLDYLLYKDSTFNITNDVIDGMNKMKWEK